MLSIHRDIEEEAVLQRERDEAEERGYPAWAADWCRQRAAAHAEEPRWTIPERKAYYAGILAATRPEWDYGRIYLNANEMRRGETYPPSLTTWQTHVEDDAMRDATR